MKLYVVPTNHIQQYWHLAEPLLQKALDKGNGEFTASQLKLLVIQGHQQLLMLMDEDKCDCAFTVQWINFPNERVAYITYMGGRNTKAGFEDFKVWVKNHGGNCIQGSTKYESIVRLFNKLYGYEKKYILMELKI